MILRPGRQHAGRGFEQGRQRRHIPRRGAIVFGGLVGILTPKFSLAGHPDAALVAQTKALHIAGGRIAAELRNEASLFQRRGHAIAHHPKLSSRITGHADQICGCAWLRFQPKTVFQPHQITFRVRQP